MAITNGYCTLLEFQARTGITDATLTAKTSLIEAEIERNSRIIDNVTGNLFYNKTLTSSKVRYNFGINSDGLRMQEAIRIYFPADILTLTSVVVDGVTWTEDEDYFVGVNFIEAYNYFPYNRKTPVIITGTCGYESTPKDINEICLAMTEVTTGLGTYTMIDASGSKMEVTRDVIPDWVFQRISDRVRFDNYG